jgi:hypothetical protein
MPEEYSELMPDEYAELKSLTPEQRLLVFINHIDTMIITNPELYKIAINYLTLGFRIAKEDGWKCIAPSWLDDFIKSGGELK